MEIKGGITMLPFYGQHLFGTLIFYQNYCFSRRFPCFNIFYNLVYELAHVRVRKTRISDQTFFIYTSCTEIQQTPTLLVHFTTILVQFTTIIS